MKKLLLSAITALAFLFGFASCSGNLHDASEIDLSAGAVPGAMNAWDNKSGWTSISNNIYTYEFTAAATEAEWKCIATAGNWNSGAFGGSENTITETPVGSTVDLTYDNATGGYKNAKITGMEIGSDYRITVTVNVLNAICKIDCIKAVPKFFMLIEKSDGTVETENMTPVTGGYNYLIKKDVAGSIKFAICGANMLYYSAATDISVGYTKKESAAYDISSYTTFNYEAGEYLIFVGTDGTNFSEVTLEVKYGAILKSGFFAINGPMGITPLEDNGDDSYSVEFTAVSGGWGADNGDMCFTLYGQTTADKMNDNDKWWDGTIYRAGGFDVKVGEQQTCIQNGDNLTLKAIEENAVYKATFTSDADNIYILVEKK